jgi:hypothetical protein
VNPFDDISMQHLVEKSDDLGALDLVDLSGAELRIDEPLEDGLPCLGRAQPAAFALEIFLGDGLERVRGRTLLPAPLSQPFRQRIAAPGDGTELHLRFVASLGKGEAGLERHAAATAGGSVLQDIALLAARQHEEPEAALLGIPDDDMRTEFLLRGCRGVVILDIGGGNPGDKGWGEFLTHCAPRLCCKHNVSTRPAYPRKWSEATRNKKALRFSAFMQHRQRKEVIRKWRKRPDWHTS